MFDVLKAIKERRSVRTFSKNEMSESDIEALKDFMASAENPFSLPIEFLLVPKMSSPVVVGTDLFIVPRMKKEGRYNEAFGYSFEKIALFGTSEGIGTLFIGGTMKRGDFEKAISLRENEVMPCVSPVGYIAKDMSLREKMMRNGVKADERLPLGEIAFSGSFDTPYKADDSKMTEILECVRLAPSAVNKQPWRLLIKDGAVHFYLCRSKGFSYGEIDMQKIDLGIALCHFELSANALGYKTEFIIEKPENTETDMEYIASYKFSE